MKTVALACLALVPILSVDPATAQRPGSTDGALRVVAPRGGLALQLVRLADTTQRIALSTRSDAQAVVVAPAGDYRLRSLSPHPAGDTAVAWDLAVTVLNDRVARVELSERNGVRWDSLAGGREEDNARLERARRATVRLIAGVTKGTGIYLDTLGGLVLATTDFLGEARVVAVTAPGAAVAAQEVARDTAAGLALLRLPAEACAGCAPLRMADPQNARPGDPIAVLTRPPHQEAVVVSGRVTAAESDSLATTVAPTLPLAGGAVVDRDGNLLAVLTCLCGIGVPADQERGRVIPSGRLAALLARATEAVPNLAAPAPAPTVATPDPSPAMHSVRGLSDTATLKAYERFVNQDAGNFRVSLVTPAYLLARLRAADQARGSAADWQALSEEQRVVRTSGFARDWIAALGDLMVPALALDITPDAGQTGGALRRALLPSSSATVRFKADLQRAEIFRNGAPYEPIAGARFPLRIDVEVVSPDGGKAKMHDATTWGYYLLPPEALMPDSAGTPPSIILRMSDLRHPGELAFYELRADVVARAWNDFAPYYESAYPGESFRRAHPGKFRSRLRDVRGR